MFSYVHPVVYDVYYGTLQINRVAEILSEYDQNNIPVEIQLELDDVSMMFAKAEKRAIQILGSRKNLNEQLIKLHAKRGES